MSDTRFEIQLTAETRKRMAAVHTARVMARADEINAVKFEYGCAFVSGDRDRLLHTREWAIHTMGVSLADLADTETNAYLFRSVYEGHSAVQA